MLEPEAVGPGVSAAGIDVRSSEALLRTRALQSAIFNSANVSSIATDAKGVIQSLNDILDLSKVEAGCDGYIAQPMRYRQFLATVTEQLVRT